MKPPATWKKNELQVADLFDGERVPVTGRQRGSAPDIDHPIFAFEVKRRDMPAWFKDAFEQAIASVREHLWPLVVYCQKGKNVRDGYCVMRTADFLELYERAKDRGAFERVGPVPRGDD